MTFIILPVFDSVMLSRVMLIGTFWFFLQWIYGACTGLFTPGLRHMASRKSPMEKEEPPIRQVA